MLVTVMNIYIYIHIHICWQGDAVHLRDVCLSPPTTITWIITMLLGHIECHRFRCQQQRLVSTHICINSCMNWWPPICSQARTYGRITQATHVTCKSMSQRSRWLRSADVTYVWMFARAMHYMFSCAFADVNHVGDSSYHSISLSLYTYISLSLYIYIYI